MGQKSNGICTCFPNELWWDPSGSQALLDGFVALHAGENFSDYMKGLFQKGKSDELNRTELQEVIPTKGKACGYFGNCCGWCTRTCHQRCVVDILLRCYMLYISAKNVSEDQRDSVQRNIISTIEDPDVTYHSLNMLISSIIDTTKNTELNRRIVEYGQNPYKFDYSPTVLWEQVSEKKWLRKWNKETGDIEYIHWPESGMCPFCIPRVNFRRATGRKPNRTRENNGNF